MNNFKSKLDDMMGDTSKQQRNIAQGVREKLQQPKQKRSWQMPVVSAAFVAVLMLLIASFNFSSTISQEGRGMPYDPLEDLAIIAEQRQSSNFSAVDDEELLGYPLLEQLESLQYIDTYTIEQAGIQFAPVVERQTEIFSGSAYGQGDVVRTMTNTSSHLPIYNDAFYEVIAVPGDRVVLQSGELKVNGKKVESKLLEHYEAQNVKLAGGYDQLLNAREYMLINRYPAPNSLQPVTINAVHKIYGKVVGITEVGDSDSIYDEPPFTKDYTPDQYFDRYLYDLIFGDGSVAETLAVNGQPFSHPTRISEYFLEAGYRSVHYVSDTKAEIRYSYNVPQASDHVFNMYKQPGTNVWQWGP